MSLALPVQGGETRLTGNSTSIRLASVDEVLKAKAYLCFVSRFPCYPHLIREVKLIKSSMRKLNHLVPLLSSTSGDKSRTVIFVKAACKVVTNSMI